MTLSSRDAPIDALFETAGFMGTNQPLSLQIVIWHGD